jgi:uncharacterized phage-associated protein
MSYDAKAIANYYLDAAEKQSTSLTPMKLQKLIFFAHGWYLALFDEPLIADQVEAWQFGPVVPSIYHEFKHERSGSISSKATGFDFENFELTEPEVPESDERSRRLMEKVWQTYSKFTAFELSKMTHLPDTPWAKARENLDVLGRNVAIEEGLIKNYFKGLAQKNRAGHAETA